MSSGSDRWVEFNDFRVKTMPNGWSEIINNCLMSNAYPSVLVYEKMDESDLKEQEMQQQSLELTEDLLDVWQD